MTSSTCRFVYIALAMAAGATAVAAQGTPVAQASTATTPAMRSAMATLKSDLRNLATAEESAFADSNKYTARIGNYVASRGNRIVILSASTSAWTAMATSEQLPGMSCVAYVGNVAAAARPATMAQKRTGNEGEPTCDELPKATPVDVVLDKELASGYLPSFTAGGTTIHQGGFEASGCAVHWENVIAPVTKGAFDSVKVSTFVEFEKLSAKANGVDTLGLAAVVLKSRGSDSAFTSMLTVFFPKAMHHQLVRAVEGGFFLRDKAAQDRALAAIGRVMEYCTPK